MRDMVGDMDAEMDARLERLASDSPTPRLPRDLAELPWTVQRRRRRLAVVGADRAFVPGIVRGMFGLARLAATVAFLFAIAYGAALVRADAMAGAAPPPRDALALLVPAAPSAATEVVVVDATGDMEVNDAMVSLIRSGISRAEQDHAAALIIQLGTPGGRSDSMTQIVTDLLEAQVPTVVWVEPSGARAASAGTFITLAANIDLMAPATHIGAASPISSTGEDIPGILGQKVKEDARAQIRSIAQQRHPKAVEWADTTVANAKSYTDSEAIAAGAVDGSADSLTAVLAFIDGKTVTISGANGAPPRQVTIDVKNANRVLIGQSPLDMALTILQDPNIAFILLVLGVLALLFEFFHPTLLVGILGVLSLVLSFYGAGTLPVNILGVALVILGIAMLVLEPSVPSHGLLTVGGLICFVVGAIFFYGSPGPYLPEVSVAWPIIITMTLFAAGYGLILVRTLMSLRRATATAGSGMVGTERVVGTVGEVRMGLDPLGTVYVSGEAWSARTADGQAVATGAAVRVVGQEGLTLIVEPVAEDTPVHG